MIGTMCEEAAPIYCECYQVPNVKRVGYSGDLLEKKRTQGKLELRLHVASGLLDAPIGATPPTQERLVCHCASCRELMYR